MSDDVAKSLRMLLAVLLLAPAFAVTTIAVTTIAITTPLDRAHAQRAAGPSAGAAGEAARTPAVRPPPARRPEQGDRLPPDSSTSHTVTSGDRTLRFTVTAGSIPVANALGQVLAEVATLAYTLDRDQPGSSETTSRGPDSQRPVTFAFNGGPGSASTWLHLGALGPWRVPLTPAMAQPSVTPTLLVNAETWLDFTDLVFIDPVGTGFSRIVPREAPPDLALTARAGRGEGREDGGTRWFWSVGGDVEAFADVIHTWLRRNDRLTSPKMLVGESYGGFRAPRIAHLLQRQHGVGINAMVLMSPVLDFEGRRSEGHLPFQFANLLPSIAAAAMERRGIEPTRANLAPAERAARGEVLADLLAGPRDAAAVERLVTRVAALSDLPVETVRRYGGRLSGSAYMREAYRAEDKIASLYDVTITGFDPNPHTGNSSFDDPFTTGLAAPLTSAMLELYARFEWQVDRPYQLLSSETNRGWVWGNSLTAPESITALKQALSLDRRLRVLVTHGFTDVVTPYMATALQLDQLPSYGDVERVRLVVYPGGHMSYSRDRTRGRLHDDARALIAAALASQTVEAPGTPPHEPAAER